MVLPVCAPLHVAITGHLDPVHDPVAVVVGEARVQGVYVAHPPIPDQLPLVVPPVLPVGAKEINYPGGVNLFTRGLATPPGAKIVPQVFHFPISLVK